MSKEIAQTVGGKRIAWLIAIVAAFAVFATVGTQWRSANATLPTTTAVVSQSPAGPANINPGSAVTYTLTVTLSAAMTGVGEDMTIEMTPPANLVGAGIVCAGGTAVNLGATCHQDNNVAAGVYTMTISGTAPATGTLAAPTGARVCYDSNDSVSCGDEAGADIVNATNAGSVGTLTINGVTGTATVVAAGQASTVTFSIPIGLTYCSDGTGANARAFTAPDQTVLLLNVVSTTPDANLDTAVGTHTVVVTDDATPGGSVSISTHLAGAAAGAGCTTTTVTLTAANFLVPELRHMSDTANTVITNQEVSQNVRGSRHTVCLVQQNTGIDLNDDGDFTDTNESAPVAVLIPGITLANIVITNGGGYLSTADTDPDFTDVRIFTGDGTATGLSTSTVTAGLSGATCISWVSTDAGDQQINIVYVGLNGVQYNASWDTDGDANDADGVSNDGTPNTSLIKEWNRLEDSTLTLSGGASGSVSGTGATGAISKTIGVTLNPATGLYQFTTVSLSDIFRGSHTNSAGVNEGKVALAGVNWTVSLSGCGSLGASTLSGVTLLQSAFSASTGNVTNNPSITFDAGGSTVNCGPGRTATITFTGTEPGPLGSGTGITVTETATFTFSVNIAEKKIFLAWAGQRIILEQDWRLPPGDVDGGDGDSDPDPLGVCAFDGVTNSQFAFITYVKGSGPGNFLPTDNGNINGSDQITVAMDASDNSQTDQANGDNDIVVNANGMCISRALFESEDQGQVDIEAFWDDDSPQLNSTKVAFVIYYMKINTINVSLVTQVSKPSHNSSAVPDYSPGNPWDASKDDADNAADWNVSKDLLVRGRVTGWFVNSNPSGRAADTSNPLNVLPANRWVMPQDWPLLAGGPADPADGTDAIGTAEQFRPYYDIMFAPNNTRGIALGSPTGVTFIQVTTVVTVTGVTNTAAAFRVATCGDFAGVSAGWPVVVGATAATFTSCVGGLLTVAGLTSTPAAGTPVFLGTGVPFEGPYSTIDIVGLAAQGLGGAALSDLDPNNIRDAALDDGDVDWWDAPMPPAPVSVAIRGTGFIKQVLKRDVYYLGAASATNSEAAQLFPNPYYYQDIPASPFIPAVVAGGGYFWDTWALDGPGGNGQGAYQHWVPAIVGTNSEGIGDSYTAAQAAELAVIRTAFGDNTISRDLVVYTDNHGEFMVTANGDYRTDLTACATNVLAGGKHCKTGDKVGTGTITATVDYPDFRGKHFPVLSNAATVTWTWGGYKDVTVEAGETDQFKYIVFHALDRDGFCASQELGLSAVLLHPVLSGNDNLNGFTYTGNPYNGDPNEYVDFLIDSGEGIIIGSSPLLLDGKINDGKQFATGVGTFSVAVNDPASTGIKEFPLSSLAASGQVDECQAWIKVSNSLLGILNVLAIAHDDEGNIGFDKIIDLTNTTSYTLNFRWSLVTWAGANDISVSDAIKGTGTSGKNPGGNDISASVTAIYGWDAAAQQWLGYFPSGVNVPGANDLVSLKTGQAYWIAITGPSSVTWTIASNVN